jgi:NADP-dependent 3-hydroxy acid dehydrogenase YdfG
MSSTTAASDASLRGRSAVISGASRGIGLECARALHAAGARVILVARGTDALAKAVRELGDRASAISCDMSDPDSVVRGMAEIHRTLDDGPDILVNNAGLFFLAPVERTSVEDFERALKVNLTSPFAFIREFLTEMKSRHRGHIVTIGSIADHQAYPENAAYAASKYGARGLHEVLRAELRGTGVRVTLISPGPTDTAMWDDINPDARPGFTPRAEMLSAAAVAHAVHYVVTCPDEVNIDELRLSRT